MNEKSFLLQIFTGGYLENKANYEMIKEKIMPLLETMRIQGIIIGWSAQADYYDKIIQLAHSYGTECYLWLPVFSENGLLEDAELLVDDKGDSVKSYALQEGENFEFYCPNQSKNRKNVIHVYEKYFEKFSFDGVFLDKIRYGSFSNGIGGVFNCFCEKCQESYKKEGLDIEDIRSEMENVRTQKGVYRDTPLGIYEYSMNGYQFKKSVWKNFFDWKGRQISYALQEIIDIFRQKHMKIGVDTLSPFMAEFVGQNYKSLMTMVDFVKPMMYGITNAPAGLPFEYSNLLHETIPEGGEKVRKEMNRILGIQNESVARMDVAFVKRELSKICQYDVPVMCGIEINRIAGIAEVTPEYIQNRVEDLLQTQINGFVFAWDILSAPQENIQALRHILGEEI